VVPAPLPELRFPPNMATMTTWEYTTSVLTHGFMGRHSGELDRSEFQAELTRLGADGWELATVMFDIPLNREKDGHLLVFKRRVD